MRGKKISGAEVRLGTGILGLPHGIHITAAGFADRDGAIGLAAINAGKYESVDTVLADSASNGESFAKAIKGLVDAKVEVARRNEAHMFIALPKRWIVENHSDRPTIAGGCGRFAKGAWAHFAKCLYCNSFQFF